MSTLIGTIEDKDTYIEELEFGEDVEELHVEMQATMNFVVANINKEMQALLASKAAKDSSL